MKMANENKLLIKCNGRNIGKLKRPLSFCVSSATLCYLFRVRGRAREDKGGENREANLQILRSNGGKSNRADESATSGVLQCASERSVA